MKLKDLLNRHPDPEVVTDSDEVRTPHERAKEQLEVWDEGAETLYLCEACNRVFVSFDVLYDHLWASDEWDAGDDSRFDHYRELTPGDGFPAASAVGETEPCEATYL